MDDLNYILACDKCLHSTKAEVCPDCKIETTKMPVLLLKSLRLLKVKGWVVDKCEQLKDINELTLSFYLFAPPPAPEVISIGINKRSEVNVFPIFANMIPTVLVRNTNDINVFRKLYNWVNAIPCFILPFAQGLCDKCISQGADWYFSRVNCPLQVRFRQFSEGFPTHCPYIVEQTLTMPDRCLEMEDKGFFDKNPIARQRCTKWMKQKD